MWRYGAKSVRMIGKRRDGYWKGKNGVLGNAFMNGID
jgi:hypothetical protein